VGETFVDQPTERGARADRTARLSTVSGAVIARGEDCRQVFQHLRPGVDIAVELDPGADPIATSDDWGP
jgi:hypothetical protein